MGLEITMMGCDSTGRTLEPSLSDNAEFLFTAVFEAQPDFEAKRRFFPVLRQWAISGKAYRGRTFTRAEIEEAIDAVERQQSGGDPRKPLPRLQGDAAEDQTGESGVKRARGPCEGWWPRWAVDAIRGVEVLAPGVFGKGPIWTPAVPVAIGYRGQKKKYLFVRSASFEMDCRRHEVRPVGGGRTAEQFAEDLSTHGEDPARHPNWTDGTDVDGVRSKQVDVLVRPGIPDCMLASAAMSSSTTVTPSKASDNDEGSIANELEDEFERMQLLHRSSIVKMKSCDHPDPLSEPRTTASIRVPPLTKDDIVRLPRKAAEERLSSLQLETVTLAARRFRQSLPDGRTAGYVVGDGTGCGKGRVIASLLFHMWNCGHRRSVWVSATNDLFHDACRDLQDLGADIPCMPMRKLPPSGPLDQKGSEANKELVKHLGIEGDGVIFLTYSLLVQTGERRQMFAAPVKSDKMRRFLLGDLIDERLRVTRHISSFGEDEVNGVELQPGDRIVNMQSLSQLQKMEVPFTVSFERVLHQAKGDAKGQEDSKLKDNNDLNAWNSRLGQLVSWLGGGEAKGIIAFDEVHKAKNLVPDKNDAASTKTGLYVELLQQYCPQSPVLYVSATAATEVQHLGYMGRLGLWGAGTAFEDFQDFAKTMEHGGVAAMEMLAMNMKAVGASSCKALSYAGTEFKTQQTGLTQAQRDAYDASCRFWQTMLKDFAKFADARELKKAYLRRFFPAILKKKGEKEATEILGKRLWQFYWGAQQRFFKAMCNAAKVPAAAQLAQEAVARGEQVLLSIWATGEARSTAKMAKLKDETPGRVLIDCISEGSILEATVRDKPSLARAVAAIHVNMRMKSDLRIGGQQVKKMSKLLEINGRRVAKPEDAATAELPARLLFRASNARRLVVEATISATAEKVKFELKDDSLGERVIVGKVIDGPPSFRKAEIEGWHIKTLAGRPVGKLQVRQIAKRLRKGVAVAFQDALVPEHLSGPQMIVEHFIKSCFLVEDEQGNVITWAAEIKNQLLEKLSTLTLPPNAMDELVDLLGGLRKVAEMSGRSHRMKRKKDGTLAYVARSEELKCSIDGANMVEQVLFQKGAKKMCIVTEVASAGISLHADRRQVRKGFKPPRRLMISVELPWGADKAIQVFGRVHRANQLVPPHFVMLCTPLGGEVRFLSAIARRMKLLGAVTKGDRMAAMGGAADRHMAEFDINNPYGVKALSTLYRDTASTLSNAPELLELYKSLNFIGKEGDFLASGRWPEWQDFAKEVSKVWHDLRLIEDFSGMLSEQAHQGGPVRGSDVRESDAINRFFNRILMLEIDMQNGLFEAFFAIYCEYIRIDRANGDFDEGIENLNRMQGRVIRQIKVLEKEVLYREPKSGAETCYIRLELDRGISWKDVRDVYDALPKGGGTVEGFYGFRMSEDAQPIYILVKERLQVGGAGSSGTTWIARKRRKQYVVWRADSGVRTNGVDEAALVFSAETFTDDTRYESLQDTEESLEVVEEGWTQLYEATAHTRIDYEHILTGDVLSPWRLLTGPEIKPGSNEGNLEEEGKIGEADGQENDDEQSEKNDKGEEATDKEVDNDNYQSCAEKNMGEDDNEKHEANQTEAYGERTGIGGETEEKEQSTKQQVPEKGKQGMDQIERRKRQLQIVRAITQPHGDPIVGMRIKEEELPNLRYVLSCQQQFTDPEADRPATGGGESNGVRLVALKAAQELVRRLANAPDGHLPLASWLDAHKMLAQDDIVPSSADGLRGLQVAVDLLVSKGLVKVKLAKMFLKDNDPSKPGYTDPPMGEELEKRLFPEEFYWGNSEDDDDDDDNMSVDCAADGEDGGKGCRPADKKQKKDKDYKKEKKSGKRDKKDKKKKKKKRKDGVRKEKTLRRRSVVCDDATGSPHDFCKDARQKVAKSSHESESGSEACGSAKKSRRSFGDNDREGMGFVDDGNRPSTSESEVERCSKDVAMSGDLSSEASDGEEEVGDWNEGRDNALDDEDLDDMAESLFGKDDDDEDEADEEGDGSCDKGANFSSTSSIIQKVWTYEVTGNKLGIREGPDVDSAQSSSGYLASGEFFNVSERIIGKDGRTYLKLHDGRGWAYDRSAKDIAKVVVKELAARSLDGR